MKSPVCTSTPAGVWTATARASGIEWFTEMNSQWNGPATWSSPAATSTRIGSIRCSRSLAPTSARVNRDPISGMSPRIRSRYGTAPMWSSWPWVRTTASMSSSRCSITPKSGRIRSMPGCSASGNRTPQSMTSSRPSNSSTAMFRPISPRPPSAMTRRPPSGRGGGAWRSRCGWRDLTAHRLRCPRRPGPCAAARPARAWRRPAAAGPARRAGGAPCSAALTIIAPWPPPMMPG